MASAAVIIAEGSAAQTSRRRAAPIILGGMALALGSVAAILYARAGLSLSHYDAKAHLVVARRVLDSLTPGSQQIGAIWLPLPHLINLLPVQIDFLYRTGLSAIAVSVAAFGASIYALAWLTLRMTDSTAAALAATSVVALNPNLIYLQATPMTEPLLLALTLAGIAAAYRWMEQDTAGSARTASVLLAAACWTRYEAWAVTAAVCAIAPVAARRDGFTVTRAARDAITLGLFPLAAVVLFLFWSRLTVGQWLVTGGFFVRENVAAGNPGLVLLQVVGGLRLLTGRGVVVLTLLAVAALTAVVMWRRGRAPLALALAPLAAAALPAYAYFAGHPFRVRYGVPLIPAAALAVGVGIGLLPRGRAAAAILVAGMALIEAPPLSQRAPVILEAQWDAPTARDRQVVTAALRASYRGEKILASMASLAHYMHELSGAGLHLRDFVHEGNGELWTAALAAPRHHVGWILIREADREGRDVVGRRVVTHPGLLDGFERAATGGTVALYRRIAE